MRARRSAQFDAPPCPLSHVQSCKATVTRARAANLPPQLRHITDLAEELEVRVRSQQKLKTEQAEELRARLKKLQARRAEIKADVDAADQTSAEQQAAELVKQNEAKKPSCVEAARPCLAAQSAVTALRVHPSSCMPLPISLAASRAMAVCLMHSAMRGAMHAPMRAAAPSCGDAPPLTVYVRTPAGVTHWQTHPELHEGRPGQDRHKRHERHHECLHLLR